MWVISHKRLLMVKLMLDVLLFISDFLLLLLLLLKPRVLSRVNLGGSSRDIHELYSTNVAPNLFFHQQTRPTSCTVTVRKLLHSPSQVSSLAVAVTWTC